MAITHLITVLIDSYNYGQFIEQAVESVLSQGFPPEHLQVIVVDDGSTDDTTERLRKYDSRIEYLRKENGGQGSAFNAGFAQARGELVVLLDADDFFLPGKLRRVFDAFCEHHEVGMIYHRLPQMHGDGKLVPAPGFQELSGFLPDDPRKLAQYTAHQTSCLAFRRGVLQELLPMPESLRIQADAYLELIAVLVTPVLAIPEELAVYRIHGKNLCATDVMGTTTEAAKRIISSSNEVIGEIKRWIVAHPQRIGNINPERLLNRMTLPLNEREFEFDPPNRLRYFAYLCRRNETFSPLQSAKITIFNYAAALAALFLGYRVSRWIYGRLGKHVKGFQRSVKARSV